MDEWSRAWRVGACLLLGGLVSGCLAPQSPGARSEGTFSSSPAAPQTQAPAPSQSGVVRAVTYTSPTPLEGLKELTAEALVQQVLARNPTLAQTIAAWQAASARVPQVSSLDDPMLGVQAAPGAWGSHDLNGGVRVDLSQRYPWPGKLALRGASAAAEAGAALSEVGDARLQLVEAAQSALADYYLAEQALEVSAENLRLLREFRQNAEALYRTGKAPQQDMLQADVEIGRQQERQLTLGRMRRVAVARLNTLMHQPPDRPLPPPPSQWTVSDGLPSVEELRSAALARRPDLQALAARIAAEEANLGLAHKEYCPDFELMAAYDSIWQETPLRPQVGLRVNLPVRRAKRAAAVSEAEARLAQRRAELARLSDRAAFEVQQAYEQVRESEQVVRLYEQTILPKARENVRSARSEYINAKIPFLTLIEAQRNAVDLQDRYYEAVADYHRRRATLERVVGGSAARPD